MVKLPQNFTTDFSNGLTGRAAYNYLSNRGLTGATITSRRIGYCPIGPLRGCVVLPVYEANTLVYYVARSIYNKRYKNAAVSKKTIVYNIDAVSRTKYSVLCEGIFDALSFGSHGLALLGKSMGQGQMEKIINAKPKKLFICLDADAKRNAVNIGQRLSGYVETVRLVSLTGKGKDPSTCSTNELACYLQRAVPATKHGIAEFLLS